MLSTYSDSSSSLEEQIDVSERLFDTWPILIYPCRIYDTGLGQLRAPKKGQDFKKYLVEKI